MAEFRKLPTQTELQNMLFMEQMRVKNPQQIAQEALASGTTITPIPENVFQKIAGGARTAKEYVNRAGTAADIAKLFPGYQPETKVTIPTGYNFAPKQAPTGEIIPGGLQTQNVNLGQVLQAIKPADVLGISGAERAYSDIGAGKAPQPLDVLDIAGLGATGLVGGKAALRATKGMPVGLSIQEAKGLLTEAPRSPLGFYSALEESALNLQRNKGSGQAFLNDLQKAPNVKADEIKWTGLDEFLKTKPNVTKQEVQDYLANNRVNVEEVQLGTNPTRWEGNSLYVDGNLAGEIRDTSSGYAWKTPDGQYNLLGANRMFDAVNKVENNLGISVPESIAPKFGQYTLPGGENYRELLLTMPNVKNEYTRLATQVNNRIDQLANEGINLADLPMTDPRRAEIEGLIEKRNAADVPLNYVSTHFPNQPNILAHLRVNDRVDADGKKMLLIEEVQSDWHQAGREKGYQSKDIESQLKVSEERMAKRGQEIRELSNRMAALDDTQLDEFNALAAERQRLLDLQNEETNLGNRLIDARREGVPDAPFKDSWYQLALKRAIQHAAENGYDRIGLTTGSQQAARFDLSKQLSRVSYQDGVLHGYDKSGALVMNKAVTPDELPNYVGKELGSKMAENAAKDAEIRNKISVARYEGKPESEIYGLRTQLDGVKTDYAGLDLQVGGEGMKKYYDEIYPKFLDKYGKKWGARVGETKIQTRSAKEAQEDAGLLAELGVSPDKISTGTMERIRYIDITPEMKSSVSKGQPLFQALPAIPATGLLATQDDNK